MSTRKESLKLCVLILWSAGMCVRGAGATTVTPYGFSTLVEKAAVVVEGTVVDLQVVPSGPDLPKGPLSKSQRLPAVAAPESPREDAPAPARRARPEAAAQAVGVEGGRMLFTRVTLAVERNVVGHAGSTVTFHIAGGELGTEEVKVFGMPAFELGRRYLVFLRPGYTETAAPIVGVHQGFFEVATTDDGEPQLLDAKGDVVVAVEDDRVVCRHNPERDFGSTPRLAPAPVPEPGSDVRGGASPEVVRYWLSEEAPLPVDDFVNAILHVKEKSL